MPRIEVNIPTKLMRDIEAHGKKIGFRTLKTTIESLIQAGAFQFVYPVGKVGNTSAQTASDQKETGEK